MNKDLIKNKSIDTLNGVQSRGEVNTHLDHQIESPLTSDQKRLSESLIKYSNYDGGIKLNLPLTANTNKNMSMKNVLILMKKLSLRVNYAIDKNFYRSNKITDITRLSSSRISFWCFFQESWNNNHVHFYISTTRTNLADVVKEIEKQWLKLDTQPNRSSPHTIWNKTLVDADVRRYLGYSCREYIVDKDMQKRPKNEQYESFEPI